jgi:hypothetical protein
MPPSPPPQGRSTRLALALGASLFAMLWLAGWSHAATIQFEKIVSDAGLGHGKSGVHSRLVTNRARALAALQLNGWGGVYTTTTGEQVTVYSSNAYPIDPAANQATADFIAGLIHGKEISKVTVYMAPAEEVAALCQSQEADGCYYPSSGQLVSIGQDSQYSTVEEVLTHEYGHHIATNRFNDPWLAVETGTKRWATVENVCRKTQMGLAFPGDEGEHYLKNPGEAFAESYLHLNEVRKGEPETHWFYDAQFYPSKPALDAIEQDVLQPWDSYAVLTWKGRFARRNQVGIATLKTPLDGVFELRLAGPRGSQVKIYGKNAKQISRTVARGLVCGQRSFVTSVTGGSAGAFTAKAIVP